MEVYIKTSTSIKKIFLANLLITVHGEIDYSVLPSFQPLPVSGQKKAILTLHPPKRYIGKTNISAIN